MHKRVSCNAKSYICILKINFSNWRVRYLFFGLVLFFGVVFVFRYSIRCSTVAGVTLMINVKN